MKFRHQFLKSLFVLFSSVQFAGLSAFGGTATTGDLYFTTYQGKANVNKVPFNYDGTTLVVSPVVNIAQTNGADGLIFAPDKDLLVGGQGDRIHKVNATTGVITTHDAGGDSAYHMSLDPSQSYAWASGIPGDLAKIPLNPFANGTRVPLKGDDTRITSLAFQDATHAFYTSSGTNGYGNFGTLDMTTFTTHRVMTKLAGAHGMAYDAFTGNLMLFAGESVLQIDPASLTIVSSRVFSGGDFDQGTADGKGHLFVASGTGTLLFIDYSATKKIGDLSNYVAQPFIANNMDDVAPLSGLGSNPDWGTKPPPPPPADSLLSVSKALYQDADGNGRIDQAWVEFPKSIATLPSSIQLQDPFSSTVIEVSGNKITRIDDQHILIDFKDKEFSAGTGFDPKPYGKILADKALYDGTSFVIGDGVGPRINQAQAFPPQKTGDNPTLTVTFSEGVVIDVNSKTFPFDIKRKGSDPNGKISVVAIKDLGDNTFQFTFDTTYYPIPGDSIRIKQGSIADGLGNKSNMKDYIGIGGDLPKVYYNLVSNPSPLVAAPEIKNPIAISDPILLVDPTRGGDCLNCKDPSVQTVISNSVSADPIKQSNPFIVSVKVNAPFNYDIAFYDNLGTFVNRAKGAVDQTLLSKLSKDKDGNYLVGLYWWPVSTQGNLAGTGAYIARGSITTSGTLQTIQGSQGDFQTLSNKSDDLFFTFGYLRR